MPGIFISYRREDSQAIAGRLADRLVRHFGAERVFRDVDTINPVALFAQVIAERLQDTNRPAEAEPIMQRSLNIFETSLGIAHPNCQTVLENYLSLLAEMNRKPEADALRKKFGAARAQQAGH